jgi:hypothetical protein
MSQVALGEAQSCRILSSPVNLRPAGIEALAHSIKTQALIYYVETDALKESYIRQICDSKRFRHRAYVQLEGVAASMFVNFRGAARGSTSHDVRFLIVSHHSQLMIMTEHA